MHSHTVARVLCAGLTTIALLGGCSATPNAGTSQNAAQSQKSANELKQPTDFSFDASTGKFTFKANDDKAGYYYVRIYALRDGQESGDMIAASQRLKGGSTGDVSGSVDISTLPYGDYHVNLVTYAAAGTDYTAPDPIQLTLHAGVGGKLERPELLAIYSGNQAELVLDWWTLCDWNSLQYLPQVQFTFYKDEGLTQVAKQDIVDTHKLLDTMKKNPPGTGYIWGEARDASVVRWHTSNGKRTSMFGAPTETLEPLKLGFVNNNYAYTLDPGIYYVVAQAKSDYSFIKDSDPSVAVKVEIKAGEPSADFGEAMTPLYKDPDFDGSSVTATPNGQPERVDLASAQKTTRELD